MYGEHVYRAVLESGVPVPAATVHLVDPEYDTGPAVAEQAVPLRHDDNVASLRARVPVSRGRPSPARDGRQPRVRQPH